MLTNEERDVVVNAMKKYPAGVQRSGWGKSEEFFNKYSTAFSREIEELEDSILLKHG